MNLDTERKIVEEMQQAHSARIEAAQDRLDAAKAQIALPDLVGRLSQQTEELVRFRAFSI
jgi:hypothetical protein